MFVILGRKFVAISSIIIKLPRQEDEPYIQKKAFQVRDLDLKP